MPAAAAFTRLLDTMTRLRAPGGCPWDREQSRESLRPYLIEEAYEVLEAINSGDLSEIKDELGDLLLQVVFHAQIASERGEFTMADVCEAVNEKLERRHPHVFGSLNVRDSAEVLRNWATIKAAERSRHGRPTSAVAGVPASMPALLAAERIGEKVRRTGFDWLCARAVLEKVREELDELERELEADSSSASAELGDLLLSVASLGRHMGTSAELALREALARFMERFRLMESRARAEGRELAERSPDELEQLWQAVKRDLTGRHE